jgi:hypothetical protein
MSETDKLVKAVDLTATIIERIRQVKSIIGDEQYRREIEETRPYIHGLMGLAKTNNPLSATIDFIERDGTLSHLAASVLICSAAEMCDDGRLADA